VETRRRDQRRELLDEFLRREDDVGRAVAPAVLQAIEERSVGESGEPLGGDGRAGHVAASCGPGSYADLRDHFVVVLMG
jgi:hypothetical protein